MEAAHDQTTTAPPARGPEYDGPTDITNVAKGKRTKRQRPQSPIRFAFSPSNNNEYLTSSPLSSSGFRADSITTEDEDTAESLILLSRGQSLDVCKFNSKKYIQSSTTGAGGVFVYECKTCSRTFSSFQALGGHRASHKKPRNYDDMRKPSPFMDKNEPPPPPPEILSRNDYHYSSSSSLSLHLNNRGSLIGSTTKPSSSRLHECSICGTEFNSGQALGGHMRRHRVAGGRNKGGNGTSATTNATTNATTLSLVPYSPVTTVEVCERKLAKDDALCLGLDLNLPAPRETTVAGGNDDQRQKRGGGFSPAGENENKQPPAVHLSTAPTMVDCHY